MHPGSGSVRYVFQDNRCHDNGKCGIFYCLRTTHSLCQGNRLMNNGGAGISIGERDTDHHIEGNTIEENGGPGILFRNPITISGDRIQIMGNTIAGNHATPQTSGVQIVIPAGLHDIHMERNTIHATSEGSAVTVGERCTGISFVNNVVGDRPQQPQDVTDSSGSVTWQTPPSLPPVGPESLPQDGAAHLNWARLPQWKLF